MTAIKILKEQHREVERLLDLMLRKGTPPSECDRLLGQLARALHLHNALEEDLIYAAAQQGRTELMAAKAEQEHRLAEQVLGELTGNGASDQFLPRLLVLKDLLMRHVDVEEKEFLPKVEALLGVTRLAELGAELERRTLALEHSPVADPTVPRSPEREQAALAADGAAGHA